MLDVKRYLNKLNLFELIGDNKLFLIQSLCPSVFQRIPNRKFFLIRIFPYSDWIREDMYQKKNSLFGHFSRSPFYRMLYLKNRALRCIRKTFKCKNKNTGKWLSNYDNSHYWFFKKNSGCWITSNQKAICVCSY